MVQMLRALQLCFSLLNHPIDRECNESHFPDTLLHCVFTHSPQPPYKETNSSRSISLIHSVKKKMHKMSTMYLILQNTGYKDPHLLCVPSAPMVKGLLQRRQTFLKKGQNICPLARPQEPANGRRREGDVWMCGVTLYTKGPRISSHPDMAASETARSWTTGSILRLPLLSWISITQPTPQPRVSAFLPP